MAHPESSAERPTAARPNVEPVEVDARPIIAVGTAAWLIALILMATVFRHSLQQHHATWWMISCGIGAGLGLYGIYFAGKHLPRDDAQE